jgi:8-oxo-dGTP pyrophosphatase MutT (NUDIX family)
LGVTKDGVIASFARSLEKDGPASAEFARTVALQQAARVIDAPNRVGESPRRPAAVLVPLIDRPGGMTVLLTQRTEHLADHAGQISFPGGSIEPDDPDATAAALREAREEIGLSPQHITVIGRLDTYLTGSSGFVITPVVGIVAPSFSLALDPFEVAEVFEVPLSFVLDPSNHRRAERVDGERRRAFFVLPYENRNIWGATAAILVNLFEVLSAS